MNVFEYVYAYVTEEGNKGMVRADDYEEAIERIRDEGEGETKWIIKLDELDAYTTGVIPEERITKEYRDAKEFYPRITQFSIDVVNKDIDMDKIKQILTDNGVEVVGITNEYGWEYDEYY